MKIENYPSPSMYQAEPKSSIGQSSYQQLSALSQASDIKVTTSEGDIVTFSQDFFSGSFSDFSEELSQTNSIQTFTSARLTSNTMEFGVQGDLNEEELSDIKNLFKDLYGIAKDFFNGDIEGAMQDSLQLNKHMGSLSEVNASFSQATIMASSQTQHYIPQLQAGFAEDFMKMEENKRTEDIIAQTMRSQWQQIIDMLGLEKEKVQESSPQNGSKDPILVDRGSKQLETIPVDSEVLGSDKPSELGEQEKNPYTITKADSDNKEINKFLGNLQRQAQNLLDAVAKTINKHPRISPFIVPLTDNAIEMASTRENLQNGPENSNDRGLLKGAFMDEYRNWLLG